MRPYDPSDIYNTLLQNQHTLNMLNEFQMHECKQIPTHTVANVNLETGSMPKDTILD